MCDDSLNELNDYQNKIGNKPYYFDKLNQYKDETYNSTYDKHDIINCYYNNLCYNIINHSQAISKCINNELKNKLFHFTNDFIITTINKIYNKENISKYEIDFENHDQLYDKLNIIVKYLTEYNKPTDKIITKDALFENWLEFNNIRNRLYKLLKLESKEVIIQDHKYIIDKYFEKISDLLINQSHGMLSYTDLCNRFEEQEIKPKKQEIEPKKQENKPQQQKKSIFNGILKKFGFNKYLKYKSKYLELKKLELIL